ncbi:MAG: hypothetical protein CL605_02285 [Altibacter sp.]|uniref:hypothetical protein n=1 Tax=Altibacter sp. TaxID=2024823 RepID=UPI000C8A23C3|nr:hypothetical protein [Altibacter sp.]MAP53711.1 hypothetical protein [Altibacter sp.]|tara:strand:+ start:16371 stop:17735 length:1365 start_codon:yes stop_codon:yes gene_type:complete
MTPIKTTIHFRGRRGQRVGNPIVFTNKNGWVNPNPSRGYRYRYRRNNFDTSALDDKSFTRTIKGFLHGELAFCVMGDLESTKNVRIAKKGRSYFINGDKISLKNLVRLLQIIIYKMPKYKDSEEIDDDVCNFMETPTEITSAMVNKIKYTFFTSKKERVETLLDLERTGPDSVAIQLYTDIWFEMPFKQAVMFIRACQGSHNKYTAIPFQNLYHQSTGKFLTDSQEKIIEAFMIQNKSTNLVTKRSMELVEKLHKSFPNVHELTVNTGRPGASHGLYVRGPGACWMVITRHEKGKHVVTGRQDVQTICLEHIIPKDDEKMLTALKVFAKHGDKESFESWQKLLSKTYRIQINNTEDYFSSQIYSDGKNLYRSLGSICIDQTESRVSVGDQIASRVMVLINDKKNIDSVSTLRGYDKYFGKKRFEEDFKDGVLSLQNFKPSTKNVIDWLSGNKMS